MDPTCDTTVPVKTFIDEVKNEGLAVWDAISDDPNVKNALAVVATMGYEDPDRFHHATCCLLNCISYAYVKAKATASDPAAADPTSAQATEADPAQKPTIIFSSARNSQIPGDYLGAKVKPDLAAFVGDMTQLAIALRASVEAPFRDLVNFPLNLSFGQWQLWAEELDQSDWYLSALKRCRPDLPTVYGLFLDASKRLMIVSVNACGSWSSDPVNIGFGAPENPIDDNGESSSSTTASANNQQPIPSTDTWIAYVVLLHQAHAKRDTRFSLIASTTDPASAQWQVTVGNFMPTVRPFHAALGPGRMSWASFALDPSPPAPASPLSIANGFLKTSWQDIKAKFHESTLLERAHEGTWLPGLVRPWSAVLDPSRRVSLHDPPMGSHYIRQAELVYLASLGQPLSQCRSALHFLKTIYDAAETHMQLINRGILHGDMSWFNVLCNPWHDNATVTDDKQVAEGIPCIDYILTGAKESQPCALVLDLDHAADIMALYASDYAGRDEKTGTPMFVSIELSSRKRVEVGTTKSLTGLARRLGALDERPQLLRRAFPGPDGDHNFMQNLHRVVELEKERMDSEKPANTSPKEPHKPHHDVESLYWILVWGFGRACPSGHNPHGKANDALSQFVETMLNHSMDEDHDSRAGLLAGTGINKSVFHELFHDHYYPMLADLATYLAIPWHRYSRVVNSNHANVAIRRLLLPLIDDISEGHVVDIFFDTAQPRTAVTDALLRLVPSNRGPHASARAPARTSVQASARASERTSIRALAQVSERPIKSNSRCKATPTTMLPTPSLQHAASSAASVPNAGNDAGPVDVVAYMNHVFNLYTEDNSDNDDQVVGSKRAARYEINERAYKRAKDNRDSRDVDTLIKMFWDDRTLWFASGFRNQDEARAVVGPSVLDRSR